MSLGRGWLNEDIGVGPGAAARVPIGPELVIEEKIELFDDFSELGIAREVVHGEDIGMCPGFCAVLGGGETKRELAEERFMPP